MAHTPGPWEYIPGNEHHGPYVAGSYGGDVCDCYAMSNPADLSTRNGGDSKPIPFMDAEANARLIASAPDLFEAVQNLMGLFDNPVARRRLKDDALYPEVIIQARAAIARAKGE